MTPKLILHGIDWSIFGGYLLLVFLIAWWSGRRQKSTAADYFLAGGALPWWVIGSSMVMACLSTEQMVGQNGASYKYGLSIALWDAYMLPPVTMLVFIFLPIYLRKRVNTIPEFLSQRYGVVLRDIFSILTVVSYTLIVLAMVLYTGSTLFRSLFPISIAYHGKDYTLIFWSVFLIVVTALYILRGGLASVAWADALHFVVLCFAGATIFYLGMKAIAGGSGLEAIWGGWEKLKTGEPDRFHLLQPYDHPLVPWPALFMRIVTTQLYYNCANQFIVQKTLAAKSDWDARMGALMFAVVGVVLPFVDIFPGMIAYHLNPNLPDANTALSYVFKETLPVGLGIRGLILAGMTAAILSTLASVINATSTVFTLDLYKQRINPAASEAQLLRVGRIVCVVVTIVALLWSPVVGRYELIFNYFQSFISYVAAPSGAIFLLGVFWRRATQKGALAALFTGLPFCLILDFIGKWKPQYSLPFVYISFMGWVLSMAVLIVVSLYDTPPVYSRIKPLLWDRSALREPLDNGKPRPWFQRLWFWYLIFASIWFFLMYHFR